MTYYGLTKTGKQLAKSRTETSDELKVLRFIFDSPYRRATSDELDCAVEGGHLIADRLVAQGYVVKISG